MKAFEKLHAWLAAAILTTALFGTGCHPQFVGAAFVGAAAAVTVLALHDSHHHSPECGHRFVVVERRPVYYYDGAWEYHDSGRWYRYHGHPRHHRRR